MWFLVMEAAQSWSHPATIQWDQQVQEQVESRIHLMPLLQAAIPVTTPTRTAAITSLTIFKKIRCSLKTRFIKKTKTIQSVQDVEKSIKISIISIYSLALGSESTLSITALKIYLKSVDWNAFITSRLTQAYTRI